MIRKILLLIILFSGNCTRCEVVPAPLFCDNAVLQREKAVPVWGRANPGEQVSVSFGSQNKATVTDAQGQWLIILDPMPATHAPADLIIKGDNEITVRNILVGEVWLCAGQSNMEWPVDWAANAEVEIAAANYPKLRHFKVAHAAAAMACDEVEGSWQVCSSDTVGKFSATAYYFGRELFGKLDVAVGLINCSWGGTQIESWMSPHALQSDESWPSVLSRWERELKSYLSREIEYQAELDQWLMDSNYAKAEGKPATKRKPQHPEGVGSRRQPGSLYYGMLRPLIPAAIRGVIWYQGESNAARYKEYRTLFPSLIRQWRADFLQGDLPFYYVQLPNYKSTSRWGNNWALMREAQQGALKLPNTGQIITIDIGDWNDIHPKNKQEAGRRLALHALSKLYGKELEFTGPVFAGFRKEKRALRLFFRHADGLHAKDPNMPGFGIADKDRKFKPAKARLEGETVIVYSKEARDPVAVRYAWANNPGAALYNSSNLPAAPFRSDDWE